MNGPGADSGAVALRDGRGSRPPQGDGRHVPIRSEPTLLKSTMAEGRWGTTNAASTAFRRYQIFICGLCFQHLLQRFQPVGLARRLVPAQPADAGKAHGDAGFVPGRALQALESNLQHQALVSFMNDVTDGAEFLDGVAADKAVD